MSLTGLYPLTQPNYLTLPNLDQSGFFHFFGTRGLNEDGVKRFNEGAYLRLRQVHGNEIVSVCGEVLPGTIGDALMTNRPGTLMTVSTADCLPIVIIDPDRFAASVIHAGWRGTVLNISAKVVLEMRRAYQSNPSSLWAGIGPGIGSCCFEVGREVWQEIEQRYAYGCDVVVSKEGEKAKIDLVRLNQLQLLEAGLLPDRIADMRLCTVCNPSLFYSYRRDKSKVRNMMSGVMLKG